MGETLKHIICQACGAREAKRGEVLQSLWSGYGEIVRYRLLGGPVESVIVKHVSFPSEVDHPRGWHNDHAHQRKVRSYEVEMAWYHDWSSRCDDSCRVPRCYASQTIGADHLMILEDLDAAGYPARRAQLSPQQAIPCLNWLANLHATFLGDAPHGLWPIGSYWHLATRQREWQAIEDQTLRDSASTLDQLLNRCQYQTLIHGDAKVENFCFSSDGQQVAAVDFQYTGGGCGMKDVAYFLGSCLSEQAQQHQQETLLDHYFHALGQALQRRDKPVDAEALEQEWRALFPIAQADFYRFLVGWSPGHWKIHDYSRQVAMRVVHRLQAHHYFSHN